MYYVWGINQTEHHKDCTLVSGKVKGNVAVRDKGKLIAFLHWFIIILSHSPHSLSIKDRFRYFHGFANFQISHHYYNVLATQFTHYALIRMCVDVAKFIYIQRKTCGVSPVQERSKARRLG